MGYSMTCSIWVGGFDQQESYIIDVYNDDSDGKGDAEIEIKLVSSMHHEPSIGILGTGWQIGGASEYHQRANFGYRSWRLRWILSIDRVLSLLTIYQKRQRSSEGD